MFKKLLVALMITFTSPIAAADLMPMPANEKAHEVLDNLHKFASEANWDRYFALFNDKGIFIGTDKSEYWTKAVFNDYARKTDGWTYKVKNRNININADGDVIWFHEILWNDKYGTSRGTGTLLRIKGHWEIAQYHLTFPVPNDLSPSITKKIMKFEKTVSK